MVLTVELIQQAKDLRTEGLSYSRIGQQLQIGESTAWNAIHKPANPDTYVKPRNLSYDVISRFLKGAELEQFWKNYEEHRLPPTKSRRKTLTQPLTKEELDLLKIYFGDLDLTLAAIAAKTGIRLGNLYMRILRLSLKVIAQHPEVLDQIQFEG